MRRLLNVLTALSLLLFFAVAALWVRGYWKYDQVNWFSIDNNASLASGDGVIAVIFGPNHKGTGADPWQPGWRYRNYKAIGSQWGLPGQVRNARYRRLQRLGIAYDPDRLIVPSKLPPHRSGHRIYVPHWLVLVVLAAPPAAWAWRRRRRRRAATAGMCPTCGYDLRATPGRCPECGEGTAARLPAT